MDKKNIKVVFMFKKHEIILKVSEKINNLMIPIFKDNCKVYSNDSNLIEKFLQNSIKQIERRTETKIKYVDLHIEQLNYYNISNDIFCHKSKFSGENELTSFELEKIIKDFKKSSKFKRNFINALPFKYSFKIEGIQYESYEFPINKKVMEMETFFSITKINENVFNELKEIFYKFNLQINKIITPSQIIPIVLNTQIEKTKDNFVLDINENYTSLYFIKNNVTIFSRNLNTQFDKLINSISSGLKTSKKETEEIMTTYFSTYFGNKELDTILIRTETIIKKSKIINKLELWVKELIDEVVKVINSKTKHFNEKIDFTMIGITRKIELIKNISEDLLNRKIKIETKKTLELKTNSNSLETITDLLDNKINNKMIEDNKQKIEVHNKLNNNFAQI